MTQFRSLSLGAAVLAAAAASGDPVPAGQPPGRRGTWNGYERRDFQIEGRDCIVVLPTVPAAGRPWIWRARFWGHEPQTDIALLGHGFHLVYMDVAGLFGCPQAVTLWDAFYRFLVTDMALHRKAVLEGMSRGGLMVYNWAIAHPEQVACIYADAPVCDFKSWPRGRSESDWRQCLDAYGLTEAEAIAYPSNPIDRLAPLAAHRVPLLHVCGALDTVVPVAENTAVLAERYRAMGGSIEIILKPDCGHHPHSLPDPAPIVSFILRHTLGPERPAP